MGTAREDFERFVRWLHEPEQTANPDVRQFANLVLDNFNAIVITSRQRNQRSGTLATLARQALTNTAADLPALPPIVLANNWPFKRLRKLTVGPFRGFRTSQDFDLQKGRILCYGPNGSGKSSFCEALEYALLGSVEEADFRRLRNDEYLANLHAGRFAAPLLTATDNNGAEIAVQPSPAAYRFCFVEKNRIDAFARLAARPPARRVELIATLFGMERFNEFVDHFNESMDVVLTLVSDSTTTLTAKREALNVAIATRDAEAADLANLDRESAEYASAFQKELDLEGLKALVGSVEAPGRLQALEAELNVLPPEVFGISRERLLELYRLADENAASTQQSLQALEQRRGQISFRDLFQAVLSLRELDPDRCPACETPLANTARDPYAKAEDGLRELGELAELEADHEQNVGNLHRSVQSIRSALGQVTRFLEGNNENESPLGRLLRDLPEEPVEPDWWKILREPGEAAAETPSFEELLAVADRIELQDRAATTARAERQANVDERDRLNDARVWIAAFDQRRSAVVQAATAARQQIEQWEVTNAALIELARIETDQVAIDRPIKAAYDGFVEQLRRFRNQLPGLLMADINRVAMDLYNEFNHGDREEDKLAELRLPLTGDSKIEIAFRGTPARLVDALAVLSEGHIRCLGLSILLAKATSVRAPLVVFDDAINAIDHDHRSGIRAAIFETDRFANTQIILTCHSPEFIKDVENNLPAAARGDSARYVLLHHDGDYQPRVNPGAPSANYLVRANQAMGLFDPRDALGNCRRALEMLTQRAWKWLESHGVGDMAVLMDGPKREPQLRALCEALAKRLSEARTFAHASKDPLLDGLRTILGIPIPTLVWTILNKGTHEEEDRDDFDLDQVRLVITTLEGIDRLELRPGR